MSKSIHILLALAGASAVLFMGCGGSDVTTASDGNDSTLAKSEAPQTKAEFIKQADLVCEKAKSTRFNEAVVYRNHHQKELNALAPIPAEEKMILVVVLPSVEKEVAELKAISVPKQEKKKIARIMTAINTGIKRAEREPYAIEAGSIINNPFRKANNLIRGYGFAACRNIA
jgi:hypothetical protein